MNLKIVSDASTPEATVLRHAAQMRELFGRMLQVAAGGGGIEKIGSLLLEASESFKELMELDDWVDRQAVNAIKAALEPQLKEREHAVYHSFAANMPSIVQMALRVAAHERLESGTPQRNAEHALRDAISPMLDRPR